MFTSGSLARNLGIEGMGNCQYNRIIKRSVVGTSVVAHVRTVRLEPRADERANAVSGVGPAASQTQSGGIISSPTTRPTSMPAACVWPASSSTTSWATAQ
jgi:hypothetical protein